MGADTSCFEYLLLFEDETPIEATPVYLLLKHLTLLLIM